MHTTYKRTSLNTIDKRLQPNPNKRGPVPLFDYPFELMSIRDSVTYPANVSKSFPTIRRAACRHGEALDRTFITRIMSNGSLGIERIS